MEEIVFIADFLGVDHRHATEGLKYLGVFIRPCKYRNRDWRWLVDRCRMRIGKWTHRWLSLGGRLVMVQAVLTQLMVYWAHIFYLPQQIIDEINSISAHFLWGGDHSVHKYHLVKWKLICRDKSHDGWGILDLRSFNSALLVKTMWRALTGRGIWNKIIYAKYITGTPLRLLMGHVFSYSISHIGYMEKPVQSNRVGGVSSHLAFR